jgi:hypothetical protein
MSKQEWSWQDNISMPTDDEYRVFEDNMDKIRNRPNSSYSSPIKCIIKKIKRLCSK